MDKSSHWIKQIDRLLGDQRYEFAWGFLKSVKDSIRKNGTITDKQIQAVKNIKYRQQF